MELCHFTSSVLFAHPPHPPPSSHLISPHLLLMSNWLLFNISSSKNPLPVYDDATFQSRTANEEQQSPIQPEVEFFWELNEEFNSIGLNLNNSENPLPKQCH